MSSSPVDFHEPSTHTNRLRTVVNWVLALGTILGAAVLVLLAYGKVMGTAACTADTCEVPSDAVFTILLYGPPVVAGVTVLVSFVTAKRRTGIVVPLLAWLLLAIDLVLLTTSFHN